MLASFFKVPKSWRLKTLKIGGFRLAHCRLTPRVHGTPANIRINQLYCEKLLSLRYIFATDSVGLSSFKFSWWDPKRMYFDTVREMAVQGRPRSLIFVPNDSAYAASYESSIVTSVLFCPVSHTLQVFCWEERPHPIPPEFLGYSPWIRLPTLWLRDARYRPSASRGKNVFNKHISYSMYPEVDSQLWWS